MAQNTNLNVTPYYDDFDKTKNFYRVLFRPGYPIQARELTTMQSVLQNQIEGVGSHLFKDGAMVIPGQVGYDTNVDCILLQESFLGANVEDYRSQLDGKIIQGLTTGVKAKVLYSISATDSEKGYITLYVKYITSGSDTTTETTTKTFDSNEQLITDTAITFGTTLIEVGSPFAQLLPTGALEQGSVAYVQAGVYFIRGFFVDVPYQYILLDQYGTEPQYRIGLEILESIVTPEDDLSLNDNAAGTSNYAAPGSHRFRITTNLIKKLLNDDADKDFIELLRINKTKIEQLVDRSAYDELERTFAIRTYEESGDYTVQDFDITTRECLSDGENDGVYEAGETTDSGNAAAENYYTFEFGPGTAYVKGYRVSTLSPTYVDALKPRDTLKRDNSVVSFELGNYTDVKNVHGFVNCSGDSITNSYQTLEFYDTFNAAGGDVNGNKIGLARVASIEHVEDPDATFGNADDKYRLHIFDTQMFIRIKMSSAQTIAAGSLIVGGTSGARGYIVDAITSADSFDVYQVDGQFLQTEMITVDGLDKDTIAHVHVYQYSDVRQVAARDEGNNAVEFTADYTLLDTKEIQGSTFTYDATGSSENIIGVNSNYAADLRAGDRIFFSDTKYVDVKLVTPSNLATVNTSTIFDYGTQKVFVTPGAGGAAPAAGVYTSLVRHRARIEGIENADLFSKMPKPYIASISDESCIVRRTFDAQAVSTGALSITLPENEQFQSISNENITVTVLAGTNSTHPVGDQVPLLTGAGNSGNLGYTTLSGDQATLSFANLTNITSVKVTATISKNVTLKKTKTLTKMFVLKVIKTTEDLDKQLYNLTNSNLYGTRIQDDEISLGLADAYKIHAIYESEDDNDPVIPSITLVEPTFFDTGTTVTGATSGAKGRVVDFNSSTLKLSLVMIDGTFQSGETVTGFNSSGTAISGIINDAVGSVVLGSKVITDRYDLVTGQTDYLYGLSSIVKSKGTATPIRKLIVVFDYFTHSSTGDYFAGGSYSGIAYKDIPIHEGKFLPDYLDFRPGAKNLYSGSGTVAAPAYVNCSTLDFKSRVFPTSGSPAATLFDVPKVASNFRSDFTWYIGRIDKVFLDQDGDFEIITGKSAEEPEEPDDLETGMLLATLTYAPYGFDGDEDVEIQRSENRRYTMRDIGKLEDRIDNVEYYTSLNLLESDTMNTEILDSSGKNRLKNGFIVDDFTDHGKSDTENQDFNAALDFEDGICRASHFTTNIPLEINETLSSGVTYMTEAEGDADAEAKPLVTLPYTEDLYIQQPYASRVENVNPFNVFAFIGNLVLFPESDDWVDVRRLPTRVTRIEGNFQATRRRLGANRRGFAPIQWRAWRTNWTGTRVTTRGRRRIRQRSRWGRGLAVVAERRTTTTRRQIRRGIRRRVVPRIDRRSLGDSLISQTSINWMRSRNIRITGTRLKPNTRFWSFFAKRKITNYITPKIIEVIKNPSTDSRTNSTPFQPGETIRGLSSNCRFQCLRPDNWYRSTSGTAYNPYDDSVLPNSYSANTNVINHNVAALAGRNGRNGRYRGNMEVGEVLLGLTSGARAVVQRRRHVTDRYGKYRGNFFIPNPRRNSNPRWRTGTRTLRMTSESNDTRVPGAVASAGEVEFTSTGTLRRIRRNVIAVRNARVVRDTRTQRRTIRSTRTERRQVGWWDPLAQSFLIDAQGGMFITSVEVYFFKKDNAVPINIQVRTMENGYPTTSILPFSDVTIEPDDIQTSETGSVPTKFTFHAPVYIPQSIEHCFALFSDSNEYQVWISRMGEQEISGDRTISEQPYAGVLFKSQNASTWTADQYEDLKFNLYRAKFDTVTPGKLVLNNSNMDLGNDGIITLDADAIETFTPELELTLNSTTLPYTVGARLYQKTTLAEGTISKVTTGGNVKLTIKDISGSWAVGQDNAGTIVNRVVSSKTLLTAAVSSASGTFTVGETVTGGTSGSTAEVVEVVSATSVKFKYVSNDFTNTETITGGQSGVTATYATSGSTYTGDAVESSVVSNSYVTVTPTFASGQKKIRVYHDNHGMHDSDNNVTISGAISEVSSTTLTSSISTTDTSIVVADASAFHKLINGLNIGASNTGFIKIDDEIISYEAISGDNKTITATARAQGGTTAAAHTSDAIVECYNLDGIPLTEINKTHTSLGTPTLDTYELTTSSIGSKGILGGGENIEATQNIQYDLFAPSIQTMLLPKTKITGRVNTVSGTSIVDGSSMTQNSFVNDGTFNDVDLNEDNYFETPQLICSDVNEQNELGGAKSFRMDLTFTTEVDNLSPIVDTDRFSMMTTMNRINQPSDADSSKLSVGDSHDAVYITKIAQLTNPAGAIKLYFTGYRPLDTEIKVLYRVLPVGATESIDTYGYERFSETDGTSKIPTTTDIEEYSEYEYEVSGLNFTEYQIKVVFTSPNQSYSPVIKDLRAIALAV